MGVRIENEIDGIVGRIVEDYRHGRAIDKTDLFNQPDYQVITRLVSKLFEILYLGYYRDRSAGYKIYNIYSKLTLLIEDAAFQLNRQLVLALRFLPEYAHADATMVTERANEICIEFFRRIPSIRARLETDLQAAFDGDPAAGYKEEIVMCYPGFFAITVSRLAHELFLLGVPLIPRIMTEYAHSETGIDIQDRKSVV